MKERLNNEFSIIDFIPLLLNKWKKIVLFSISGALIFLLVFTLFFSGKYYSKASIVGSFSHPIETKFGTYNFSSDNLFDYTHNILDERILEKTLNEFDGIAISDAVKLEFKKIENRGHVAAVLSAHTKLKDLPLDHFLSSYFKNFLNFLNITFYKVFLEEVLVDNSIRIDKLNNDILKTSQELEAYGAISNSIKNVYNNLTGFNKDSFFSSETLDGIDILTTHSAFLKKQLQLSLLKVELENIHRIMEDVKKEHSKFSSQTIDLNSESDFIPLFNKTIRLASIPSTVELRTTSKFTIAFIGALIGFLIAMISLLAAEFRTR